MMEVKAAVSFLGWQVSIFDFVLNNFSKWWLGNTVPYCLVVRIPGSHPGGPGSIPGMGIGSCASTGSIDLPTFVWLKTREISSYLPCHLLLLFGKLACSLMWLGKFKWKAVSDESHDSIGVKTITSQTDFIEHSNIFMLNKRLAKFVAVRIIFADYLIDDLLAGSIMHHSWLASLSSVSSDSSVWSYHFLCRQK